MKTCYTPFTKCRIFLIALFMFFTAMAVKAEEFVVINRVISWDINAQDGFWYFSTDPSMPTNWLSPNNYYTGTFYTRYEIISVPTNAQCGIQFGIFQYQGASNDSVGELCEIISEPLSGVGDVVTKASSPSTWWSVYGGVDFSKIYKLQSMAIVLYSWDTKQPVCKPGQGADDHGETWSQRYNWFPITVRVTVVAVSAGSTFSGWDNYVPNPAIQKPTPTYGMDFINETTDKTVPSTDEFSEFPTMYGAINGTGAKMTLTPGRDAYFRTKAGDGKKRSDIQHFDIPCRPATPTFKIDAVNHRTATVVSSEYEYSDFSDMSETVTGNGTYVSIPAGTTKYFRKKATITSFKSNIQALNESTILPIAHEFLIFNGIVDYPNTTDTNGFYYFYYNNDMPKNWLSPEDYYNGTVYIRYEMLSMRSAEPIDLQFGIWQLLPPETGELHETMTAKRTLYAAGDVKTLYSSPSTWWKLDDGFDYTKMDLTWHMGINPWSTNTGRQIRQENPYEWSVRNTKWFPMKVYVTVVAVASGYSFSGWSNYLGLQSPTPAYTIDYANEKTSQVIAATDEYSYSPTMSPAFSGSGAALTIQPGQNVYFRTKASGIYGQSFVQRLVVPARPTPAYTINYQQKKTNEPVSANDEYSTQADMSGAVSGTNAPVTITPGVDLYFRTRATAGTFRSEIQTLDVPNVPAPPVFTINYAATTTNEIVGADISYSRYANFSNPQFGTGTALTLEPGQDLYFKKVADNTSFGSDITHLVVPGRNFLGYSGTDTISTNKASMYVILAEPTYVFSLSDVQVSNGIAQNLRGGNVFDVYPAAEGPVSVVIPANAVADNTFASNEVLLYYKVATDITEYESDAFTIYPNPNSDGIIYIRSSEIKAVSLDVLNVEGHLMKSIQLSGEAPVMLQDLPKGMYFLKVYGQKGFSMHKLILK